MLLSFIGGLLIIAGALFPVRYDSPQYSHKLHSYLCLLGSVLVVIAITLMIAIYCKRNKGKAKRIFAISYAVILVGIITGIAIIQMAALFELVATLMLLTVVFLLNVSSYKNWRISNEQKGVECL